MFVIDRVVLRVCGKRQLFAHDKARTNGIEVVPIDAGVAGRSAFGVAVL